MVKSVVVSMKTQAALQTRPPPTPTLTPPPKPAGPFTPPPSSTNRPPILKIDRTNIPYHPILSVDGGGLRGVIPLTVLIELEKKIKKQLVQHRETLLENEIIAKNDYKYLQQGEEYFDIQLADFFDFVGGVSAGSIVTAFLASRGKGFDPEMIENGDKYVPGSSQLCRDIFVQAAPIAFEKKWYRPGIFYTTYSSDGIDAMAKKMFSEKMLLSEVEGGPSLLVTTYQLDNTVAHLFYHGSDSTDYGVIELKKDANVFGENKKDHEKKNLELQQMVKSSAEFPTSFPIRDLEPEDQRQSHADELFKETKTDIELWQIIRSSAAAPTFFPAHKLTSTDGHNMGTYSDGGIIINNIDGLMMTYAALKQKQKDISKLAILSLGCGVQKENLTVGRRDDRGKLSWVGDLIQILMNNAQYVDVAIMNLWTYCFYMEEYPQYLRIQAIKDISGERGQLPEIDDVEALDDMIAFGDQLVKEYSLALDMYVSKFLLGIEKFELAQS